MVAEVHAVVARVERAITVSLPPLPPVWQALSDKVDHDDDQGAAEAEQAEVG